MPASGIAFQCDTRGGGGQQGELLEPERGTAAVVDGSLQRDATAPFAHAHAPGQRDAARQQPTHTPDLQRAHGRVLAAFDYGGRSLRAQRLLSFVVADQDDRATPPTLQVNAPSLDPHSGGSGVEGNYRTGHTLTRQLWVITHYVILSVDLCHLNAQSKTPTASLPIQISRQLLTILDTPREHRSVLHCRFSWRSGCRPTPS